MKIAHDFRPKIQHQHMRHHIHMYIKRHFRKQPASWYPITSPLKLKPSSQKLPHNSYNRKTYLWIYGQFDLWTYHDRWFRGWHDLLERCGSKRNILVVRNFGFQRVSEGPSSSWQGYLQKTGTSCNFQKYQPKQPRNIKNWSFQEMDLSNSSKESCFSLKPLAVHHRHHHHHHVKYLIQKIHDSFN